MKKETQSKHGNHANYSNWIWHVKQMMMMTTSDDYLSDDSVIHSDDEGDNELLNSSADPIKSSKVIVFWSFLVTLFNFCFQC